MKNNYKGTVFFDLDGTLMNKESQIDDSVAEAIEQLRANGYLPVISTGRATNELQHVLKATGIDSYITLNGAYIQSENQIIYESSLDDETIESVMAAAKDFGDIIAMHSSQVTKLHSDAPIVEEFYSSVHLAKPELDPEFYKKTTIPMIIVISHNGPQRYQEMFPDLNFFKTGDYSIDTVKKDVSKMHGIKHMLKGLDLEDKPVYAFGDGANDVPMIKFADHSVAMGNGIDEVKEIADFITTDNTDNGIVNGLKHFDLI
ncbi:Cof-type HAD-IIB family hydrolase [Companilactobacillus mishanensis]|uniref:Cof-type HAD-IIB family hydrolase n=1 Tax=Companilactobacillus mishanensis TaxID=2486008 RepID=A0ABW9P9A4_9LACO|nr:Cof-type HAD-IIB family hydrolase [Companilactobacillus mishanensis]MQS45457.1 Cof-type HAD-IIB family hydrolase [Companilactobacillus mishanensis]